MTVAAIIPRHSPSPAASGPASENTRGLNNTAYLALSMMFLLLFVFIGISSMFYIRPLQREVDRQNAVIDLLNDTGRANFNQKLRQENERLQRKINTLPNELTLPQQSDR